MRKLLFLSALTLTACQAPPSPADPVELRAMTFNLWGAGANQGKPINETVAAIRAANPDIVGLQETMQEGEVCTGDVCPARGESRASAIAAALGYYVYDQTAENEALWANAIISRYPIGRATPNDLGVEIDVEGRKVMAYNIHLTDYPYQPYQFLNIPYDTAPFLTVAAEGVAAARAARGAAVDLLISELAYAKDADAILVFGDFNEPSGRDWTERAVAAGVQPLAVAYPSTLELETAGLTDAYRKAHPDEVAAPGLTWTPTTADDDPKDHHDRIDYVFVGGKASVEDAQVVGEASSRADIVSVPWPSDHRAVVATIRLP